jgi:hypothetical protein
MYQGRRKSCPFGDQNPLLVLRISIKKGLQYWGTYGTTEKEAWTM